MSEEILKEISEFIFVASEQSDIQYSFDYLKEMFDYTLVGGKGTRGETVAKTYQHVAGSNIQSDKLKKAKILGCCIEILQASFLVHDDIMDNSEMRRQKPCWYLNAQKRGFGLIAVNDGLFLNTVVHKTLINYFLSEPYFVDLVNVFDETIYRTCSGQCLDMMTGTVAFESYTSQRYETIIRWKTAYYSFYLPVISGLIIAGITDRTIWLSAEKILLKIGEYFQIQDDFLDCYGDPLVIGKVGRDIEDSKCSWLIVQALPLADTEQLKELKSNYGKDDAACVKKVKKVFEDLDLKRLYHKYEDETYREVNVMIEGLANGPGSVLPVGIFTDLLGRLYKRNK